ncbi:MAG: RluA family pseudouridine synthase [Bacilli bacterium]
MNKKKSNRAKKLSPKPKHEVTVSKSQGLLAFVLENISGESRNNLKSYLRRGQITVNGAMIKQFDFLLSPGDIVRIEHTSQRPKTSGPNLEIIYEDEYLLAINKPAGVLSVASDQERKRTAYVLANNYVQTKNPRARVHVVHRLDQETSGVLLFAKDEETRNILQKKWNQLVKKRGYYAITIGIPQPTEGRLEDYLFTNATSLMYVGKKSPQSVLAITNYKVKQIKENFALLDIDIETGKKNQIRVQLKNIGCPIVGDKKYESKLDPLKRLGLHAYELRLRHPRNEQDLKLSAPLPREFKQFIAT